MYQNGPDDVGFIDAMIDELEIGYHINSSRIYASWNIVGGDDELLPGQRTIRPHRGDCLGGGSASCESHRSPTTPCVAFLRHSGSRCAVQRWLWKPTATIKHISYSPPWPT